MEKLAGVHRSKTNACRNLHLLMEKTPGCRLPLEIDVVKISIRRVRPVRIVQAWWPQLKMKTWLRYLFLNKPEFLLAGHKFEAHHLWQRDFETFWHHYRLYDNGHPVFRTNLDLKFCIPYFIHGDEGRGLARKPLMCISWQPTVSHKGLGECNDSSHFDRTYDKILASVKTLSCLN